MKNEALKKVLADAGYVLLTDGSGQAILLGDGAGVQLLIVKPKDIPSHSAELRRHAAEAKLHATGIGEEWLNKAQSEMLMACHLGEAEWGIKRSDSLLGMRRKVVLEIYVARARTVLLSCFADCLEDKPVSLEATQQKLRQLEQLALEMLTLSRA